MRHDLGPVDTSEWREAFDSVVTFNGPDRAEFLLKELVGEASRNGLSVPYSANTPHLNTIPPHAQPPHPGDGDIEHRIRSLIRWNAVAIVLRANKESSELGGHIASFQSAATLYDTGLNHFWHAPSEDHGDDLVFAPGFGAGAVAGYAVLRIDPGVVAPTDEAAPPARRPQLPNCPRQALGSIWHLRCDDSDITDG
jgi:pyruvate dehydrogenase E1 component